MSQHIKTWQERLPMPLKRKYCTMNCSPRDPHGCEDCETETVHGNAVAARDEEIADLRAELARLSDSSKVAEGASEKLNFMADQLEDEAQPYEGDFADTVRGHIEELRTLTAPATDSNNTLGFEIKGAGRQFEPAADSAATEQGSDDLITQAGFLAQAVQGYPDFDGDNPDEPRPLVALAKQVEALCNKARSVPPAGRAAEPVPVTEQQMRDNEEDIEIAWKELQAAGQPGRGSDWPNNMRHRINLALYAVDKARRARAAAPASADAGELPPLPTKQYEFTSPKTGWYTAGQMREYARAALQASSAALPKEGA